MYNKLRNMRIKIYLKFLLLFLSAPILLCGTFMGCDGGLAMEGWFTEFSRLKSEWKNYD